MHARFSRVKRRTFREKNRKKLLRRLILTTGSNAACRSYLVATPRMRLHLIGLELHRIPFACVILERVYGVNRGQFILRRDAKSDRPTVEHVTEYNRALVQRFDFQCTPSIDSITHYTKIAFYNITHANRCSRFADTIDFENVFTDSVMF